MDVTSAVRDIIDNGGKADSIGYLCVQGDGSRICSGCTSGCDQSVILVFSAEDKK